MKRIIRMFLLHFQDVFEERLSTIIYLFIPFCNQLPLIIFWAQAIKEPKNHLNQSLSVFGSYYLLVVFVSALYNSYIERSICDIDIREGNLVHYLLRPVSYFWIKLMEELPYRIMLGSYALIFIIVVKLMFGGIFKTIINPLFIPAFILSSIAAHLLSYSLKISLSMFTFWFKDVRWYLFQFLEIVAIVLSGSIVPITLLPTTLKNLSNILPFAYIIYYPIAIIQGKLSSLEIMRVFLTQISYVLFFVILYKILWNKGIKKFTAIGQ